MSNESPEKNVNPKVNLEDRAKRAREFVGHLLVGMDSWHNHKENMAGVKCIVVRMFAVPRAAEFAIATVISGKRRKLRR